MGFALLTAVWLGILTSISPCPLAANIAAISFISRSLSRTRRVLVSSVAYIAGRMLAYLAVAGIVVAGLLSVPGLSQFLQKYMNRALGPLLIITGIFLLGWIRFALPGAAAGQRLQARVERGGVWGALLLGVVFALTFCPVSAALFFGSLIPLALQHGSPALLPALYGIGTGLPVIAFAILIALGAGWVGRAFDRLTLFDKWARRATAMVFITVGIHYVLNYWLGFDATAIFWR